MSESDLAVLTTLFQEHHRQLTSIREKIHAISERTVALFLVIAGWLVVTEKPPSNEVRWIIILVVIVLAVVSSRNVYINNRKYLQIARVIRMVNYALQLHAKGRFIRRLSLYPRSWKRFGRQHALNGSLTHILTIAAGAFLCAFLAYVRR